MRTEDLKKEKAARTTAETINYLELLSEKYNARIEIVLYTDRERKPRWVVSAFGKTFEGETITDAVMASFDWIYKNTLDHDRQNERGRISAYPRQDRKA